MPSSSSGKPARKKKASKPKKRKQDAAAIREAPLQRYPSGDDLFLDLSDYPTDTDCLQFMANQDTMVPEHTFEYLMPIIKANTAEILEELVGPMGPVYLVRHDAEKRPRLMNFLKSAITVPGTDYGFTGMRFGIKEFAKQLDAFCPAPDANDFDSDFETPPSSSSEDDVPCSKARKTPAASIIQPPPLEKNFLVELRASANKLPELPVQPAQPFTEECEPFESSQRSGTPDQSEEPSLLEPAGTEPISATVTTRRRKFRFKSIDFSSLPVELPEAQDSVTILFRPTDPDKDLSKAHPKKLCQQLMQHGDYTSVRDIRNGGLAIDFPKDTDPAPILAITELAGFQVTASLPISLSTCTAVLSGVHPLLTMDEVKEELTTQPAAKVLEVRRLAKPGQEGWTVKVTFEGRSIPERGFLFGRSRLFKPFVSKPLQCIKCSRFGHGFRVCRSKFCCGLCGEEHATDSCQNQSKPKCANCAGAHAASSNVCPSRRFQTKVNQVRAETGASHKSARIAVTKAAKTYADAAKAARPKPSVQPVQPVQTGPLFKPSIAHPRPPQTVENLNLAALFQSLLTILTSAIASGDFSNALQEISGMLQTQAQLAEAGIIKI